MPLGAGPRNAKIGIDTAYDNLGIPRILSPEDMANPAVDDLRFIIVIIIIVVVVLLLLLLLLLLLYTLIVFVIIIILFLFSSCIYMCTFYMCRRGRIDSVNIFLDFTLPPFSL